MYELLELLQQYWYVLLIIPALWLYGRKKYPKIEIKELDEYNGTNTLWKVIIDPNARNAASILAQEMIESEWKWRYLCINLLRRKFSDSARREMELLGHETEVQAAVILYGNDEDEHRLREARILMHPAYDDIFSGWSEEKRINELKKRKSEAKKWVNKNLSELKEWKQKIEKQ